MYLDAALESFRDEMTKIAKDKEKRPDSAGAVPWAASYPLTKALLSRLREKRGKEKKAAEGLGGAMAGGAIGTGVGLLFRSPKAALIGGLAGAGIGGLAGGAVHATRRFVERGALPPPGPIPGDQSYVPTWASGPPNLGYTY